MGSAMDPFILTQVPQRAMKGAKLHYDYRFTFHEQEMDWRIKLSTIQQFLRSKNCRDFQFHFKNYDLHKKFKNISSNEEISYFWKTLKEEYNEGKIRDILRSKNSKQ